MYNYGSIYNIYNWKTRITGLWNYLVSWANNFFMTMWTFSMNLIECCYFSIRRLQPLEKRNYLFVWFIKERSREIFFFFFTCRKQMEWKFFLQRVLLQIIFGNWLSHSFSKQIQHSSSLIIPTFSSSLAFSGACGNSLISSSKHKLCNSEYSQSHSWKI